MAMPLPRPITWFPNGVERAMEVPMLSANPPGGAWAMAWPTACALPLLAVPDPMPAALAPLPPDVGPAAALGGGATAALGGGPTAALGGGPTAALGGGPTAALGGGPTAGRPKGPTAGRSGGLPPFGRPIGRPGRPPELNESSKTIHNDI